MNQSSSRPLLAGALILAAVGLLVLSLAGTLRPAQGLALRPFAAAQSWLALRYAAIHDMLTLPRDVATLQQRNAELEAEVTSLQRQLVTLKEEAAKAEILSALLGYARTQPDNRYLAVNVIGRDISPFIRSIWIGAGTDDGVERGMPVVTESGLVGRVAEAYATVARVQLITDPAVAVNVRLQDSRADGVTVAQPNGELWVDQISQEKTPKPSELVLTSGLGGGYPPDITVGQVLSIRKRDYELFQQAVIRSNVDFANLEIVLVITSFHPLPIEGGTP
jgi:rod shape-determining protein MreC